MYTNQHIKKTLIVAYVDKFLHQMHIRLTSNFDQKSLTAKITLNKQIQQWKQDCISLYISTHDTLLN